VLLESVRSAAIEELAPPGRDELTPGPVDIVLLPVVAVVLCANAGAASMALEAIAAAITENLWILFMWPPAFGTVSLCD
jgi:hypothetical protein